MLILNTNRSQGTDVLHVCRIERLGAVRGVAIGDIRRFFRRWPIKIKKQYRAPEFLPLLRRFFRRAPVLDSFVRRG